MRPGLFIAALLLSACTLSGGAGGDKPANPILGDAIATTTLDAPVAATPKPEPVKPQPVADAAAKPAAQTPGLEVKTPPPAPRSPEEAKCRKAGGSWAPVGKARAMTCIYQTRDSGKSCSRKSQCEGLCLARSGTCAPIRPLFGCNEILQDDGSRVTLCID